MIWWLLGYFLGFVITLIGLYRFMYNRYQHREWFVLWIFAMFWPVVVPYCSIIEAVRWLHELLSRLERR